MEVRITTTDKRQVVDITDRLEQLVPENLTGVAVVTVLHTTSAITTADLDPGTDLDLLDALDGLIARRQWRHPHNPAHAPDHLLSSIIGPSVTIPITGGHLQLGLWQRVVLVELDGPKTRLVTVIFLASV
jgi:secondary thiamine-phosphate synthase enzyme